MANHAEIAHAWAHDRGPRRTENLFREGNAIYSFGNHWMVGINAGNGFYFLAESYGSSYTSRHESHVRWAIPHGAEKASDIPQYMMDSISRHFGNSYGHDYTWELHNGLMRLAVSKMRSAIELARSKPYIESGYDYGRLPIQIVEELSYAIDLDAFLYRAATANNKPYTLCFDDIITEYRKVIDEEMSDRSKFIPYGMNLISGAVHNTCVMADAGLDWSARYPGYEERLIELNRASANRSAASGSRRNSSRNPGRAATEEMWQEWYKHERNITGNDAEGFTRLRVLKSNKNRVQSSLSVSFELSAMRAALIAFDKGIDELPSIDSSIGHFGCARIYRNGTEHNSYAVYGCHKVRISEARKLLDQ